MNENKVTLSLQKKANKQHYFKGKLCKALEMFFSNFSVFYLIFAIFANLKTMSETYNVVYLYGMTEVQ